MLVGEDGDGIAGTGVEGGDEAALGAARRMVAPEPGGCLHDEDVVAGDAARLDQDVAVLGEAGGPERSHHLLRPAVAELAERHAQRLDQVREADRPAKFGGIVDGDAHRITPGRFRSVPSATRATWPPTSTRAISPAEPRGSTSIRLGRPAKRPW